MFLACQEEAAVTLCKAKCMFRCPAPPRSQQRWLPVAACYGRALAFKKQQTLNQTCVQLTLSDNRPCECNILPRHTRRRTQDEPSRRVSCKEPREQRGKEPNVNKREEEPLKFHSSYYNTVRRRNQGQALNRCATTKHYSIKPE